jgi:glycine oxidase
MTARELLNRGRKVIVVDKGPAGLEASRAAAGILSPLPPWEVASAVDRLTRLSLTIYPSLAEELLGETGIDAELWSCGLICLADNSGNTWPKKFLPAGARILTHSELEEMEPSVSVPEGQHLLLPAISQVNNRWLLEALVQSIGMRGGLILDNTEASGLRRKNRRIIGAETSAGPLDAEQVLVAAGAWTDNLLESLGIRTGVYPVLGQMLSFESDPGVLNRIILRNGQYLVPRQDGTILAGTTVEEVDFNKKTTAQAAAALGEFARRLLPALDGEKPVEHWCGLRPGSKSLLPCIDELRPFQGLYVASGHYRIGITLAAGTARIMAEMMCGNEPSLPTGDFALPEAA